MFDLFFFSIILCVMMFMWTFVYLNRSHDLVNQAFLWFVSLIILWMVLSVSLTTGDQTFWGLMLKTLYWYSMMNLSLFFLLFVYRLIRRALDLPFWGCVAVNTATIVVRYLFPIDYSDPTFWRLSTRFVAPAMSLIFSLPALYALYLVFRHRLTTKDARLKQQLDIMFWGIGLALLLSVVSEYLLPTVFHVQIKLSLMFYAILVFVVSMFITIMKYRLLHVQSAYLFHRLFLHSSDATVIIGRNLRVLSVNHAARAVFQDEHMDSGDSITAYLPQYDFSADYQQSELTVPIGGEEHSLLATQYPFDAEDPESAKLLTLVDVTALKDHHQRERNALLEKSYIDPSTGLFNRQYLMDQYCSGGRCQPSARYSLLFLDVDNFKSVNDRFGHLVGDAVLLAVAGCVQGLLRADTVVIRYGGDEFVVILPDTGVRDACSIAERIRQGIETLAIPSAQEDLRVSLSIGVVEGTGPINELLLEADRAMYQSKSRGKNVVTVSDACQTCESYHMKL